MAALHCSSSLMRKRSGLLGRIASASTIVAATGLLAAGCGGGPTAKIRHYESGSSQGVKDCRRDGTATYAVTGRRATLWKCKVGYLGGIPRTTLYDEECFIVIGRYVIPAGNTREKKCP
jgi:hypothetical protein